MVAWPLRACVCEGDDWDAQDTARSTPSRSDLSQEIRVTRNFENSPSGFPRVRGFPTYSSAHDQPLLGVPIREGGLWYLSSQDRFESVTFHLYVNGFAFSTPDGQEASVSLSPFSYVRNCRFQSGECARLKSFKVQLLDEDPCCYFAMKTLCDREAEEERSDWVLGISHTILLITESLLPRFSLTCDPLLGSAHTRLRLLAGYLIHRDDAGSVSVLFCELNAHCGTYSRMVLYENDRCDSLVVEIMISESSLCCDIVGINCSSFIVDCHRFASQTPSERKLWLRALSNVKVKMQNQAPQPTQDELNHYRGSIREHIRHIEATLDPRISSDALLAKRAPKVLPTVGEAEITKDRTRAEASWGEQLPTGKPSSRKCTHVIL
eukprot:TRINITY_DN5361_c2_g1_i1.p1 TRINITY_DN5361_c2_g1~~TRINITY_DN5361_c2_g1_i1.p1  ORF type:complete len:415 (-),score=40.32 TRINITY_DN5361_c2_g1_i1:247-1383(-)